MSSAFKRAAHYLALHLFVCLLASTSPVNAQIELEVHVGFHGLFQLGQPFPLRVDLANLSRPVDGAVEVKVWKGGAVKGSEPYRFHYRREVLLPAQARRSVYFTVDPDSISRPLTVTFSSPEVNLSKEVDLRRHFSPSPLILFLTENSVAPSLPLTAESARPLIALNVGELPSEPRAYHGVSTVIFYEQSVRDLSRAKWAALETWLSAGGRIVVLGSIHYALYQEPSLARLLPVRVTGLKRLSALSGLEKVYGSKSAALKNVLVQDSSLVEGTAVVQEKGTPVLVEMSRGRGKVLYLSLDVGRPPVAQWQGLPLLFKDLLESSGERRAAPQTSWDDAVFSQLLLNPAIVSTYVPLRPLLLWLLAYFGALALLAWLWRERRMARRRLILCSLFLVFFSAFAGYLHFNQGGNIPEGVLLSSTLLESLPDGYVEAQSNVALFSTQRRHYSLQVESGWTDLEPVPRFGVSEEVALVVQEEGSSTRFRIPLREWDYRLFRLRSMAHFPLRTELQHHGDKLSIKVANLTGQDLTECWLLVAGQRFFLGDILHGSTQSREFSLVPERLAYPDGQAKKIDLREIRFQDRTREILFRYSFFPQDQGTTPWGAGGALFFGWVKAAPRRIWIDEPRILTHQYTLFRALMPLELETEL